MENPILSVAFVIAATQFFKTQLNLENKWALLCAFVVALIIGMAGPLAAAFPALSPWITQLLGVIGLFITAAGSYDFVMALKERPQQLKAK